MRIAVMVAGAIGGYVGGRLAAAGHDVTFIARGSHLATMLEEGLRIESPFGDEHLPHVNATASPSEIEPVDLILFTVKLYDGEGAAQALQPMVGPHTRVLTLQNGIDSYDLLARFVPPQQIRRGAIYLSVAVLRPGVVHNPGGSCRMIVEAAPPDTVMTTFVEACNGAVGLEVEATDDIGPVLWEKFIRLCAFSGATALMRARLGPILSNPEARSFLAQLVDEGVALAEATGHAVAPGFAAATMAFFATFPADTRSSMAGDLEQGKPLELRWLSGRMHDLASKTGIPTPAHSAVYRGLALYADGHMQRFTAPSP